MEAKQQRALAECPEERAVRRWPNLRGEAKLAWGFLWGLAGGRPGRITCHVGAVGEDQGTTEASGRRSLKTLASFGLIQILDKEGARWLIYVEDPLEVNKARLVRASPEDQQPDLPFEEPAPAEQPREEPAATVRFSGSAQTTTADVAQHPPSQGTGKGDISAQPVGVKDRDSLPYHGGCCATSAVNDETPLARKARLKAEQDQAAKDDGIRPLAAILPQSLGKVRDRVAVERERCRQIADEVFRAIEEPSMPRWICEEIGLNIAKGAYTEGRLQSKLALLQKKRSQWAAAKNRGEDKEGDTGMRRRNYFTESIRMSFDDCGLRLFDSQKRSPATADDGEILN